MANSFTIPSWLASSTAETWPAALARFMGWVVLISFLGATGGLMVWWFYDRAGLEAWVSVGPYFDFDLTSNPWRSISRGVIYSLSMVISLSLGMRFARRYFPLRTGLQALAHVVILSVFSEQPLR
jgi:hypothetical protein